MVKIFIQLNFEVDNDKIEALYTSASYMDFWTSIVMKECTINIYPNPQLCLKLEPPPHHFEILRK